MIRIVLGAFGLVISLASWAQQASVHLHDGSVLRGEVIGLENGVYSLRGKSFGVIKVPQNNIRNIDYGGSTTAPTGLGATDFQALQARMLMDPALMNSIQELTSDPVVQDIVNDPEIRSAIENGDYSSLMNNPKIIQLMQHPSVRSITEQVR